MNEEAICSIPLNLIQSGQSIISGQNKRKYCNYDDQCLSYNCIDNQCVCDEDYVFAKNSKGCLPGK